MTFNVILTFVIIIIGLFLELRIRGRNRSMFGYIEQWNRDGTAKRIWYVLAVPLFTQKWNHSTSVEK